MTRRPGRGFDDAQAEAFATALANGETLPRAAAFAGVGRKQGLAWFALEEMRSRVSELKASRSTVTTVSPAWIAEQLKINALEARSGREYVTVNKQGAQVTCSSPPDYKSSNHALMLLYQLVTKDASVFAGGIPLPTDVKTPKDMNAHITRFLSARSSDEEPIVVAADESETLQ